jgi:hypothetical protein
MPYKATRRNKKYLRLYKQGKSIGFTMRSSLKAKGLIPRANGTYKVSNKYQRGGAWPWSSSPTKLQQAQTAASNATQRAAYNTARSKSKVANILGTQALEEGKVIYTNKEEIALVLKKTLHNISQQYGVELSALERDVKQAALSPKTVVDTLKGLIAQLETQTPHGGGGLNAEQKAIIITIPYGLGQLTLKVFRVALYMALTFVALLATVGSGGMILGAGFNPFGATAILPNSGFEATEQFRTNMRNRFAGVKPNNNKTITTNNPMMATPTY